MAKDHHFLQRLSASVDLEDEPIPGLPLVEIAGDMRVLIENHMGVLEYCDTTVAVKVKFGKILVCGQDLCLSRMTKGQLIISGCIACVRIIRG